MSSRTHTSFVNKTAEFYVDAWIKTSATHPTILNVTEPEVTKAVQRRQGDLVNVALIASRPETDLRLKNCRIFKLEIHNYSTIYLDGCSVRALQLRNGPVNLTIRNCQIGKFELSGSTIAYLDIDKSRILRVTCPSPSSTNPFLGSVSIRRTKLSSNWENAQHYRNARHHLAALHNHDAASKFHAAELQTELGRQSSIDKVISFTYLLLSNYGESTLRPLLWVIAFLLLNTGILFFCDGVVLANASNEIFDWRTSLYGSGLEPEILRALALSFSQIFNPLGIFGTKAVVAAKSPLLEVVSMTIGFFGTLSLGLFVLALRRRFRLDRSI